jgi:hypothetical protein
MLFNNIEHQIYDNNDYNLKNDLNNSQIYVIKNKINNKLYVGKANCYTGSNNFRWGTLGRWKSHVDEAFKKEKDHCVLLNNALRKYSPENFELYTIYKGPISTIGEKESYYMSLFNSKQPNGYNIRDGGDKGKNSLETIQKMKEAHTGHVHSEKTKENIAHGQIGNRRNSKVRKYEEDKHLPKYIMAIRKYGILTGYMIHCFPIGIHTKEYIHSNLFSILNYKTKENALQEAIKKLAEIKLQYNYISEEVETVKNTKNIETTTTKKENKLKEKLSEFIFPILVDNKIAGYYVEGILDIQNNKLFPKRIFKSKTNRWNLDEANKFVETLHHINENMINMSKFDILKIYPNTIEKSFYEKYYLPRYFNVLRKKGVIRGFNINGFPNEKYSDGKFRKDFQAINGKSLNDVYSEGIDYLNDLMLDLNENNDLSESE